MTSNLRGMPWPVAAFLAYALLILALIGLSLRFVVDMAISAPVSPVGVLVMILLAYTIFTTTLVLQRKAASRTLALGLSSLTIPPIPWALVVGLLPVALFFAVLAVLLIGGLRRPAVTAWLNEP
jgi:predicted lysophospholipase L1 biosynthesis ABC-type transport system permease subunit